MLRTKTCGELRASNVGETATLCGWVDSYRDHGGLVFIDLRDRYGKTQVVFKSPEDWEIHAAARSLRNEDVIRVTGQVVPRPDDMINHNLDTGEVDLRAHTLEILNRSKTPPFEPTGADLPAEELRLRYRFLDLRRPSLQHALILRHKITLLTREFFDRLGFLEIETPMLGKSTPEGARDYLVPSRVHAGCFYALPQSPQIYKQILMVAGYDRYMQIARCFRDEDLRADRQPEFTQIDVEMAFVEREDILNVIDGLVAFVAEKVNGQKVTLPLPRFSYHDVMERYGSDKPDLRFGMELVDISDLARRSGFNAFKAAVEKPQGRVRGLNVKGGAENYGRKACDDLTQFVGQFGAKGLAFFRVKDESLLESPIAKFFNEQEQREIIKRFGGEPGDLLFLVADANKSVTSAALAALRSRLGKELKLYDPKELKAAWILDFPLVTYNEEEKRWDAEHHPFCYPVKEDVPYLDSDPGRVRAQSYDLVVNGYEAASGSVRIHDAATQQKVFTLLGIEPEEAERRFGFLLEALRYGAPPHAGIALGLDRWVMLFCGNENIREVIAFPKTQKATDLLSGAPSPVGDKQLRELRILVELPESSSTTKGKPSQSWICIYSRREFLQAPREHILQNFLGARWTSAEIVSGEVQEQFGHTIDVALERSLRPIRNMFGTFGGRGEPGPILRGYEATSGERVDLEPGFRPRLAQPNIHVAKRGNTVSIKMKLGTPNQIGWAQHLLQQRFPNTKVDEELLRTIGTGVEEYIAGTVSLPISIGGQDYFRGMLKSCFNRLAVEYRNLAMLPCFNPVREFVLDGIGNMPDFVGWVESPNSLEIRRLGPIDHFIGIVTRGQSVEGVVQFFGDIVHAFRLSNTYTGMPIKCGYLVDPTRRTDPAELTSLDFDAAAIPVFDQQSPMNNEKVQATFTMRLGRIVGRFYEKAVAELVDEVLRPHQGKPFTEDLANQLARRMAELVLRISRPVS